MIKKMLLSLILSTILQSGYAHEFKSQQFHVDHPWARPTFTLATTGAAYLSIHNIGGGDARLTGASVEAEIADEVQLHDVLMDGEMMRMRQITSGVSIEQDEMVSFTPGGKHIMLLGLKGPLNEGKSFPLTLHFEKSEDMVVIVKVETPKQDATSQKHNH